MATTSPETMRGTPNNITADMLMTSFRAWRQAFRDAGIDDGEGLTRWRANQGCDTRGVIVGN
eukprot:3810688-Pyramimonas_sp.AAC.1